MGGQNKGRSVRQNTCSVLLGFSQRAAFVGCSGKPFFFFLGLLCARQMKVSSWVALLNKEWPCQTCVTTC